MTRFLWIALLAHAFAVGTVRAADDYPAKPVRMIVPYPPGGSTDQMARLILPRLTSGLGQPIVIDNQSGGATMIGSGAAARAAPDGYTLLVTANVFAVNTLLHKSPTYKVEDFIPIAGIVGYAYVLVVHPGVAATTVAGLVDLARREPAKLNAVSLGPGGVTHLLNERFEALAGVSITDIHYRGSAPALTDLIGGQVQMYFDSLVTAMPQIRAGKLRPLAVSDAERSALLPDVPTFREVGFPSMTQRGWFGVFAPAGTPRAIIDRLHREILAATATDEARERFARDGLTRLTYSPTEFATFIRDDVAPWAQTLKALKIQIE